MPGNNKNDESKNARQIHKRFTEDGHTYASLFSKVDAETDGARQMPADEALLLQNIWARYLSETRPEGYWRPSLEASVEKLSETHIREFIEHIQRYSIEEGLPLGTGVKQAIDLVNGWVAEAGKASTEHAAKCNAAIQGLGRSQPPSEAGKSFWSGAARVVLGHVKSGVERAGLANTRESEGRLADIHARLQGYTQELSRSLQKAPQMLELLLTRVRDEDLEASVTAGPVDMTRRFIGGLEQERPELIVELMGDPARTNSLPPDFLFTVIRDGDIEAVFGKHNHATSIDIAKRLNMVAIEEKMYENILAKGDLLLKTLGLHLEDGAYLFQIGDRGVAGLAHVWPAVVSENAVVAIDGPTPAIGYIGINCADVLEAILGYEIQAPETLDANAFADLDLAAEHGGGSGGRLRGIA